MSTTKQLKGLSMDSTRFVHDLGRLVGFKTVTGKGVGFYEAMAFIQEQLSGNAFTDLLQNNGNPILLASNVQTKTPIICYLVHLDVVSGRDDQFTMIHKRGTVFGRGVSDMKFSIPIGYALLNDLIARNSRLPFMLAITSDEERGGFLGAKYLAKDYGLAPKLLIVPDGGNDLTIVNASKGVCQIRISMEGIPAHASMPWLGENAIIPIARVVDALCMAFPMVAKDDTWHTTMNIGVIGGGTLVNQVPKDAFVNIDFRYPLGEASTTALYKKVRDVARTVNNKLVVEVTAEGVATHINTSHPALQLFINTLEKYFKMPIRIEGEHGSNDARHFPGVPFIMTKPFGGDIHGGNEYLDVESTMLLYRTLSEFLQQYERQLLK